MTRITAFNKKLLKDMDKEKDWIKYSHAVARIYDFDNIIKLTKLDIINIVTKYIEYLEEINFPDKIKLKIYETMNHLINDIKNLK